MGIIVDIRKKLGDFNLDVSFEADNECLALLGASGCGKSVTLKCIAGIITPDEGRIVLNGRTLFDSKAGIDLPPQKRNTGYLFQQYALFPNMTVRQNIAVAIRGRKDKDAVVSAMLEKMRLSDVAGQYPGELSGGQQQRAALARILVTEPEIILLDEPFSALDSFLKFQLEQELRETLAAFGKTVIWVSHDRGEVWRNCPRVCVIDRGSSEPVVYMKELFHSPGTQSAAKLSGCKNYIAVTNCRPDDNTSGADIQHRYKGRSPEESSILSEGLNKDDVYGFDGLSTAAPDSTGVSAGCIVDVPEWNISLKCGRMPESEITTAGIRSHHVRIFERDSRNEESRHVTGSDQGSEANLNAGPDTDSHAAGEADHTAENIITCRVKQVIDDVFETIVLLVPENASKDAMYLRMELSRHEWEKYSGRSRIDICINRNDIMLLR